MGAVGFARAAANTSKGIGCVMGSGPSRLIGGEASGSARRRTLDSRRGSVRARQVPFDIWTYATAGRHGMRQGWGWVTELRTVVCCGTPLVGCGGRGKVVICRHAWWYMIGQQVLDYRGMIRTNYVSHYTVVKWRHMPESYYNPQGETRLYYAVSTYSQIGTQIYHTPSTFNSLRTIDRRTTKIIATLL